MADADSAHAEDAISPADQTVLTDRTDSMDGASPTDTVINASRRRIAFVLRERPLPLHVKMEAEPHMATPSESTDGETQPRMRNPWSADEVNVFFEAIKMYGKDYDSTQKYMARRKVFKSKEHIKAFFSNSVKSYRTLLSLTDEDFCNLSRDARDLFLLINACEWKRRTFSMKVIVEKFRELLFDGITNVKAGRKYVTIRTPPCHALCRYFTCKKVDKIPETVYIQLEPTSNGDHVFLRNREQNPYLRVKLSTNDRVMKLLEFLHRKWSSPGDTSPVSVTLWPDTSCEIASLMISSAESSPFISLSMNKLIRNVEETREKAEPRKTGESQGFKLAVDVNTKTKASYPLIYPKPFTLTDRVIAEGITCRNVRSAIVAELFCVCGRTNPIKLRYQVRSDQPDSRSTEPWRTLISLLNKGYGDCLAEKAPPRKRLPAKEPPQEVAPPSPKKPKIATPRPIEPGDPESEIVRQENEDFASQLALLKKTSRHRTVGANRKSTTPAIATRTPQLSIRPAEVPAPAPDTAESLSKSIFAAPKTTVIPKRQKPQIKKSNTSPCKPGPSQPSTSQQKSLPIDFSSVALSPSKSAAEIQKKRTDDFLSSLKTPTDTPLQTPQKPSTFQQYFGDELSMSPNSTRHASQFEVMETTTASAVDFTDMMYKQLDEQRTETIMSTQDLEISVTEVHQHYHDMMTSSQNSQDYVLGQFGRRKGAEK